jgi:hypothetical protein
MATPGNYFSLYGCVNKNGQPIDYTNNPLLQDVTTEQIVWVRLGQAANSAGTLVNAFEVMIESTDGLNAVVVYMYTYTGFETIMNFNGGFIANGIETPFTHYENLVSMNYATLINQSGTTNLAQGMLINDRFVANAGAYGRRYQASTNSTFVKVKFQNRYKSDVFEFDGNWTTAGSYSLFYTAS